MRGDGERLIRRICDEIGPDARPWACESGAGIEDRDWWGIEVMPPTSFLRVAEVARRNGLGRARLNRNGNGHLLLWTDAQDLPDVASLPMVMQAEAQQQAA
jgi:hypothetical protein